MEAKRAGLHPLCSYLVGRSDEESVLLKKAAFKPPIHFFLINIGFLLNALTKVWVGGPGNFPGG